MEDTIIWFPKGRKEHTIKFLKWWFGSYEIQYCLPNNIVLFVIIDKFEPNPIFVNINKLRPFRHLDKTPKGLEATIEGEKEHKEDLQENFQDGFTKIQSTPKIIVNQKPYFGNNQLE
jgi:hypothetical protein